MLLRMGPLVIHEQLAQITHDVAFALRTALDQFEHRSSGGVEQMRVPGERIEDNALVAEVKRANAVNRRVAKRHSGNADARPPAGAGTREVANSSDFRE